MLARTLPEVARLIEQWARTRHLCHILNVPESEALSGRPAVFVNNRALFKNLVEEMRAAIEPEDYNDSRAVYRGGLVIAYVPVDKAERWAKKSALLLASLNTGSSKQSCAYAFLTEGEVQVAYRHIMEQGPGKRTPRPISARIIK